MAHITLLMLEISLVLGTVRAESTATALVPKTFPFASTLESWQGEIIRNYVTFIIVLPVVFRTNVVRLFVSQLASDHLNSDLYIFENQRKFHSLNFYSLFLFFVYETAAKPNRRYGVLCFRYKVSSRGTIKR